MDANAMILKIAKSPCNENKYSIRPPSSSLLVGLSSPEELQRVEGEVSSGGSDVIEGDSDTKSDARTCDFSWESEESEKEEEEEEEEEVFYDQESIKRKIRVLAQMVGIEGYSEAGLVLAEVVKVLKELDDRAREVICYDQKGVVLG